ncbi:hypothetical protein CALCODRAFT_48979 [Calocera cornea HHB12733]|uniref:Uncharacterized protein n=1 Tax=Calocera cornea HHB12733 TaxID=1353952 RepID=A0A165DUI7_9BASI|nr:hypothetical protein CALCODRAFT_48979 [Calocera cornea HHB12733]
MAASRPITRNTGTREPAAPPPRRPHMTRRHTTQPQYRYRSLRGENPSMGSKIRAVAYLGRGVIVTTGGGRRPALRLLSWARCAPDVRLSAARGSALVCRMPRLDVCRPHWSCRPPHAPNVSTPLCPELGVPRGVASFVGKSHEWVDGLRCRSGMGRRTGDPMTMRIHISGRWAQISLPLRLVPVVFVLYHLRILCQDGSLREDV